MKPQGNAAKIHLIHARALGFQDFLNELRRLLAAIKPTDRESAWKGR